MRFTQVLTPCSLLEGWRPACIFWVAGVTCTLNKDVTGSPETSVSIYQLQVIISRIPQSIWNKLCAVYSYYYYYYNTLYHILAFALWSDRTEGDCRWWKMRNRQDRLWQAVTSDNSWPPHMTIFARQRGSPADEEKKHSTKEGLFTARYELDPWILLWWTDGFGATGWGICGAQRGSKPCFSPSTSVCPCQYYFINATCSYST